MIVRGHEICGDRKDSGTFVGTGVIKGHYPVHVCDREPHTSGKHHDSQTNESWR